MKNKTQLDGMPVWFDGKSINEALFCEEFLQTHKIIFTNGASRGWSAVIYSVLASASSAQWPG